MKRQSAAESEHPLVLRRATPDDLDTVLAIVRGAAEWLVEKGRPDWRSYLTPAGFRRIQDRVNGAEGVEVYLASQDQSDAAAGVFSVEWSDRLHWDAVGEDGLAGYIHMLAVDRAARGAGVGKRMVQAAETVIERHGRQFARLDCGAYNAFLCGYYRSLGYRSRGIKFAPHACMRFEKQLIREADESKRPRDGGRHHRGERRDR